MFKLLKYLRAKEICLLSLNVALIILMVYFELRIPAYTANIIQIIKTGGVMKEIFVQGTLMLLFAILAGLTATCVKFICSLVGASFARRIRDGLYKKVFNLDLYDYRQFSTATLISRTTVDVTNIQQFFIKGFQPLVRGPVMAIGVMFVIFQTNWQWSTATLIAISVIIVFLCVILAIVLPKFKLIQKQTDDINKMSRENLAGIRVIRAYNAEKYEESKTEKVNKALMNTNLKTSRAMSLLNPGMNLIMNALNLAIYVIGAYLMQNQPLVQQEIFAEMGVFSSYAMQIVMSFIIIVMIFVMVPKAEISAKRILEVLEKKSVIQDGKLPLKDGEIENITFENVSFKYPDAKKDTLTNINFSLKKGETMAIIGGIGSGKSTLINMLPRFFDSSSGEIKINGVNIQEYKIKDLREKIGYVAQKPYLLSGSVAYNLDFGKDKIEEDTETEEDMTRYYDLLDTVEAQDFVSQIPNQLKGHIVQNGNNLSTGQKQRLSIARALNRNPEILILDDSFSSLDLKTDKKVREKMNKLTNKMMKIIVAQRITSIQNADKILVLNDNKVVGLGTHEELMQNCDYYKEIAELQNIKENGNEEK